MHIRKDDQVEVITGDDRGTPSSRKIAKVLRAIPERNKIVVEGINRVYKHLKPSAKNQQGGRLSKEMPIDVSNVLLYCPGCKRGVRIGHQDRLPRIQRRQVQSLHGCGHEAARFGRGGSQHGTSS